MTATSDFVIDVGGPTERLNPDDIPSVRVNLAGEIYTAYCPKDMAWLSVVRAQVARTVVSAAVAVYDFLDSAFLPETGEEIARRVRDRLDPLNYKDWIEPTIRKLIEHFVPDATAEFESMGLALDPDDLAVEEAPPTPNRAARRAAGKGSAKAKAAGRG